MTSRAVRLPLVPAGASLDASERAAVRLSVRANRPRTRGDCEDAARPCPWAGCRYHLGLDVTRAGSLALYADGPESCALDVADRGGMTLEEVARCFDLTRERVRQIEERALRRLRGVGVELEGSGR